MADMESELRFLKPRKISDLESVLREFEYEFEVSRSVEKKVEEILDSIKKDGDRALIKWCSKLDRFEARDIKDLKIETYELEKAFKKVKKTYPRLVEAIEASYKNIKHYHTCQLENEPSEWFTEPALGKKIGQLTNPIDRAGIYIPGGRYVYPSSVLMTVVPARVSGVREVAVCTPPSEDGNINEVLLYLFFLLGIEEVYRIGGAQAIAALAFGTEMIKKVDKIVGPGNIYVTVAKKKVFGKVGIDSLAGPSEIVVLADKSSNPSFIASDLLSQAEHDPHAKSILLCSDKDTSEDVIKEMLKQLKNFSGKEKYQKSTSNMIKSLNKNCKIFYSSDMEMLVKLCNYIAPEHLEIMVEDGDDLLKKIRNAGAIFMGNYSPVVVGDYIGGTNHVIPTGGTAKFSSPLGVYDFCKKTSITYYDKSMLKKEKSYIEVFSDFEGMMAHKNSVEVRFKEQIEKSDDL